LPEGERREGPRETDGDRAERERQREREREREVATVGLARLGFSLSVGLTTGLTINQFLKPTDNYYTHKPKYYTHTLNATPTNHTA
jgi:hypothetical protein